ncbi:MAG: DNA-binding protein [Candidatus Micrarchaeia archaeon]
MDADEQDADQARNAKLRKRYADLQRAQQAEAQLRGLLQEVLEPPAYERFMNVRLSNPELYMKVSQMLVQLHMQKQLTGKVSEKDLRALLAKLTERREPEFKISRK